MGVLRKVLTKNKDIAIVAIDATDALQESLNRLCAFPPSMVHLGQAMMGAALLQSLWNDKGTFKKVALQWKVDGPFGDVFAEANEQGDLRGTLIHPQAPVDNYNTKLGQGQLMVQKFGTTNSTGIVKSSGDICNDLLMFLHQSEQRHASISLSVKIGWADDRDAESPINEKSPQPFKVDYGLGFLFDVLPHQTKEESEKKLLQWDRFITNLGPISQWNLNPDDRLHGILSMLEPQESKELLFQKIHFHCNCSEERAQRALSLAEAQESTKANNNSETKNQNEPVEVQCEFCGQKYSLKSEKN